MPAAISANGMKSPDWKIASERGLEQVTATYGSRSDGGISVLDPRLRSGEEQME